MTCRYAKTLLGGYSGWEDALAKIFEVRYWFNCPQSICNKQTVNTITITANDSVDARELAVAGLNCEHCRKKLPSGYFVHTMIKEVH